MNKKVTCIIAAYNEEKRIGEVLIVVSKHPLINEIIVIDDGSIDNTSKIVRKFKKVKLISYKKNKGKTSALLLGIKKAKGDYLVLVDADLVGLNMNNLSDLINPLIKNEVDVSVSLRSKKKLTYNLFDLPVLLSGERAFKKELINYQLFQNLSSYGFETKFNLIAIQKKLRVKFVPMPNVQNTAKMKKNGFLKGLISEFNMGKQILKSGGVFGCLKMMLFMRSLSID